MEDSRQLIRDEHVQYFGTDKAMHRWSVVKRRVLEKSDRKIGSPNNW